MKRLAAALSIALLSLGAAACEAPGAPDSPAGLDPEEGDRGADTQLQYGDGDDDGEDADG